MIQVDRTHKVKGRPGLWTMDRWAEAARPGLLGLKGSLEICVDREGIDEKLNHEKVIVSCRGKSTFGDPRLVRYIVRSGFGSKLVQYDIQNSHPVQLWTALTPDEQLEYPELGELVTSRNLVFAKLLAELNCASTDDALVSKYLAGTGPPGPYDRDSVKKLILAMNFGGSVTKQLREKPGRCLEIPDWLQRYSNCLQRYAMKMAAAHPDRLRMLEEWGKDRPPISLMSYGAGHLQRLAVDRMLVTISPESVVSHERDGFVAWSLKPAEVLSIREAAQCPITTEVYPTEKELLVMAKTKYPHQSWDVKSVVDLEDLKHALRACHHLLFAPLPEGQKTRGVPSNTSDFGLVLAARLEPYLYVGQDSRSEMFDTKNFRYGIWIVHRQGCEEAGPGGTLAGVQSSQSCLRGWQACLSPKWTHPGHLQGWQVPELHC